MPVNPYMCEDEPLARLDQHAGSVFRICNGIKFIINKPENYT